MKHYCNPLNINYRYQFYADAENPGHTQVAREAADPSMIYFKGRYYIFASMTLGVYVSDDMVDWQYHRLPDTLPLYDYAPDVRVMGDYVYFCASRSEAICDYYRTQDVINGPFEKIAGTFDFWDPNLFIDTDGRMYFYWGCSNATPIWGVELDPATMRPIGEKVALVSGHPSRIGYERTGENHGLYDQDTMTVPAQAPYIEGAWMDKHNDRYYLQYACPGTEFNTYADGVYCSSHPLGPFTLAENVPYSYKPGGFMPGAGHGSTMQDRSQNLWHTATMRISMNHMFERRLGIWPAGFDKEGELFCNQRYGDWPIAVSEGHMDPWGMPDWYLLSYGKQVTASSYEESHEPALVANENAQTWWKAKSASQGEWITMDLGENYDVHAIQINFADDMLLLPAPGKITWTTQPRYIEENSMFTRWTLEGSADGVHFFVLQDTSNVTTDLPHDLVVWEEGIKLQYVRLTVLSVPYGQNPCISGLRVFGRGSGPLPDVPQYKALRLSPLDMEVTIRGNGATGYNVLWGHRKDKLYHSYLTFDTRLRIGALVEGQNYFVRVDAFNENGITIGNTFKLA